MTLHSTLTAGQVDPAAFSVTRDNLMATDQYEAAGALDAANNQPLSYGCHTGMQSTRRDCISRYTDGYNSYPHGFLAC